MEDKLQKLKETIKESGYSVEAAAKAIGVKRATLYNHLRGITVLRPQNARKLIDLIDKPLTLDDVYQ